MNKELEICVKSLVPFEELKKQMIEKDFYIQEDFQVNDIYMVKKEKKVFEEELDSILSNYVLVRETVGKRKLLVIKDKKINDKGEIIEQLSIKCRIENIEDGYNFMRNLGYKKILELKNHNILLSNGRNEIYIQDVEGLGTYIEMEQKNLLINNNNGDTIEQMIENIKKYKLPIDETNFFVKKANDILIKKENKNKGESN